MSLKLGETRGEWRLVSMVSLGVLHTRDNGLLFYLLFGIINFEQSLNETAISKSSFSFVQSSKYRAKV